MKIHTSSILSFLLFFCFGSIVHAQPTTYSNTLPYIVGDLVVSGSNTYIAVAGSTGQTPPNTTYWTDLSVAATALNIPTEEVPNLDTQTILNSLPGFTPDGGGSSVFYGISSRAYVDDAPMVGSVIITGTQTKKIMVRAKGPSMASALPNKKLLANPKITILQKINDVWSTIETSLDYGDHSSSSAYSSLSTGNTLEPMIVTSLIPGTYSMRVEDESGGSGNANLEIYEIEDDTGSSVFYGISSRAYVDDAPMVGSVIISGTEPKNVMIRAKGPSMATALPNKKLLANPKITVLQKVNGVWSTIFTSLDFGDHSSSSSYSSLSTGNDLEPMIVVSLDPGTYSMRVEDESGGTGNANLEIYEVN